ncbi:universal stress protein [Pseudonocardia acaciae]|uniref:universal stress protein n=1 Tax=Pseudonocardia acaciae TaxID=551276 RepID=UPI00048D76DD|nr:universal stress protein [Pseudonocardia acaciae]
MDARPVVVGVDGSEPAMAAVRWAAGEAARRGLPVRLVAAFGWPDIQPPGETILTTDYRAELLREAREHLSAAADVAEQTAPGLLVEQQVVTGYPAAVLRAEAEHAELLVLGHRGTGGVVGLFLGSVAVSTAAHAGCPVVVVRSPDAARRSPELPVVVGVDGSSHAEAAIAFAYQAASTRGVPLVAVHTWTDLLFEPSVGPLLDWEAIEARERRILDERLAGWSEKYPDVTVRRVVTSSAPAPILLEQAANAQLVVVGSRGRGNLAGVLLGSVSHALLHRAPCPVAVVRAG